MVAPEFQIFLKMWTIWDYNQTEGVQQEFLPIIQDGMCKKGMIANAQFIDKHVLPSLVELDETAYNVQLIYTSMKIYCGNKACCRYACTYAQAVVFKEFLQDVLT